MRRPTQPPLDPQIASYAETVVLSSSTNSACPKADAPINRADRRAKASTTNRKHPCEAQFSDQPAGNEIVTGRFPEGYAQLPALLSVAEFRRLAGRMSHGKFYTLMKEKKIRAVKVGRRTYVRLGDALEWIRNLPDA